MSKLDELIKELCPNGVEYKTLGEIGKVCMCKRIMKNQTESTGDIPFYKIGTFGKQADAFISRKLFEEYKSKFAFPKKGDVLISAAGTIGRTIIYDGEPSYYQDSNIVWIDNNETEVINKWLFYCYQTSPWQVSTGGTIARLYNDNIAKARIPVPPLPVQEEIVRILDTFTSLTAELTAELTARRAQYEYYRDALLTRETKVEVKKLGDFALRLKGTPITATLMKEIASDDGEIRIFAGGKTAVNAHEKDIPKANITRVPAVLVQSRGTIDFVYYDRPFTFKNEMWAYTFENQVTVKYVYYVLKNNVEYFRKLTESMGAFPQISLPDTEKFPIPLPPLDVQQRIVNVLDNFDSICTDLKIGLPAEIEARKKQYEYYRDLLLTFASSGNTILSEQNRTEQNRTEQMK